MNYIWVFFSFSLLVVSIIICLYSEGLLIHGLGRAGHVQCVYISLYMCIYSIPELSVYGLFGAAHPPQPSDICIQACHMTPQHEGVTASEQCSFCRLCLFFYAWEAAFFFLQFSDGRLASVQRELEEGGIPAACERTGLHHRLKSVCTDHT